MSRLILIIAILVFIACNNVDDPKIENILIEIGNDKVYANYDENTKSFIIELDPSLNWESLNPIVETSSEFEVYPISGSKQNLNSPITYLVSNELGIECEFVLKAYTTNLLNDEEGKLNNGSWIFNGDCGIEGNDNECAFFYKGYLERDCEDIYSVNCEGINQVVKFNKDFGGKVILFASKSWPEKVFPNSITGHPYMWGMQYGDFPIPENDLKTLFRFGMIHTNKEKKWQNIGNYFPLFPEVDSVLMRLSQAKRAGEDPNGSKSLFKNVECRVFQDSISAKIYFEKFYN